MRFRKPLLAAALLVLLAPANLIAQVSSAAITGAVKDSTGAAVPHVRVSATERATGVVTNVSTNEAGEYTFPVLKPGVYNITVAVRGFKQYDLKGLALSVGDHPTLDIPLALGVVSDTVEVDAQPPLLGTQDANIGQVVPRQIVDTLPINGRTPMSTAIFTEGVVFTTNPTLVRPFDNSAIAGFSVGGLPNKNAEILIDGSPNNASDNAPAYELPVDATQEVTIKVFESDATYGHSGGAVANQVSKSGTNHFHGTLSEFHQDNDLTALNFFQKRLGTKLPVTRINQFGGSIGGPVILPKLYNGKDKLFFFFAYEGYYDSQANPVITQVPTDAERKGDFSALLAPGTNSYQRTDTECQTPATANSKAQVITSPAYQAYQFYDPTTGVLDARCAALGFTVYDRQPIANDILTNGALPLSPVAQNILKYYPEPTNPNAYLGYLNYTGTYNTGDKYNNEFGRLDFVLSPRQKLYLTGRHNHREQYLNQQFGNTNPALGDFLYRENYGGSIGDLVTFSPTLFGEFRLNYTRYSQPSYLAGEGFNPSTLGLPNLPSAHYMFPRINFNANGYEAGTEQSLGITTQTPGTAPFDSDDVFIDFIKTKGVHNIKFGADFRKFQKGNFTFSNSGGAYNFDNGYVSPFGGDQYQAYQSDFASFMLGLVSNWQPSVLTATNTPGSNGAPGAATYDFNAHSIGNQTYLGLFLQDDWRVTPTFTLNAGLRVDKDFSPNEREGTANSGFDTTDVNPYNGPVTAAYAANPNAALPVANFKLLGGLTFNSPGNHIYSTFPSLMFSPRVGFSASPRFLKDTVIRGGFGIFVLPIFPFNNSINQAGFSQTTLSPTNEFAPPTHAGPGTLDNPFPNGLAPVVGAAAGLATFAGNSISFLDPVIRNGYSERWHLGLQHQFARSWMFDAFYEGSTGRRLPINESLNYVQRQYETTASAPGLSAKVNNPFYGLVPNGGSLNSSPTVALTTLLQTYPEFGTITEQNVPAGSSIYHAFDFHIEHRMGYGLSMFANYQWSKLLEAVTFLNASDPKPEYRISQYDHPTHFVAVVSEELPFGRGRHFGANAPRWLDLPLGGWNVASDWYYQQAAPLTFGNLSPTGQPLNYHPRQTTETAPAGTCPAFNINAFQNAYSTSSTNPPIPSFCPGPHNNTTADIQLSNNIRTFPSQFSIYRADAWNEWDASMMKNFNITPRGGTFFQLRLDVFNVNNRPVFSAPSLTATSGSFGQILGQANNPRTLQVAAKIVF